VDLQFYEDGILEKSIEDVAGDWLRSLPSFWDMNLMANRGDRVQRTRDRLTSPGYIVLLGPNAAVVEQDAAAIREAEQNGQLYVLRGTSATPTPPTLRIEDNWSDDDGTWGKRCLFLPAPVDPSPKLTALEAQVATLLTSPQASPELLPLACAECVLDEGCPDDDLP